MIFNSEDLQLLIRNTLLLMRDASCPFLYATSGAGCTWYVQRNEIKDPNKLDLFELTREKTFLNSLKGSFFLSFLVFFLILFYVLEDLEHVSGWKLSHGGGSPNHRSRLCSISRSPWTYTESYPAGTISFFTRPTSLPLGFQVI